MGSDARKKGFDIGGVQEEGTIEGSELLLIQSDFQIATIIEVENERIN